MARCPACEIETIDPATKGFDEACISINVNESNGVLSVDTSSMTVVDHSPHTDGYDAAFVVPPLISVFGDLGMARWVRVEWYVRGSDDPFTEELGCQIIKYSDETPPDLADVSTPEL